MFGSVNLEQVWHDLFRVRHIMSHYERLVQFTSVRDMLGQVRPCLSGLGQVYPSEARLGRVMPGSVKLGQVCPGNIGYATLSEDRSRYYRLGQVRPG